MRTVNDIEPAGRHWHLIHTNEVMITLFIQIRLILNCHGACYEGEMFHTKITIICVVDNQLMMGVAFASGNYRPLIPRLGRI